MKSKKRTLGICVILLHFLMQGLHTVYEKSDEVRPIIPDQIKLT